MGESKRIGIIGGMGPMASQLFYKMVTEMTAAEKDQDHVSMVVLSDTAMPDRTGAILSGQYEDVRKKMLADAQMLENCGCQAIGVTCNTAHFFMDMIEKDVKIPIIHMIKETAKEIAKAYGGQKIAILATDGTIKTGLYQKRLEELGLIPYIPEEELQREVMHQIYDCIKAGKPYDEPSWQLIEKSIKAAGCKKAILACTELSVIREDNGLDDFYVDPMAVLAQKMIEFSGCQLKR